MDKTLILLLFCLVWIPASPHVKAQDKKMEMRQELESLRNNIASLPYPKPAKNQLRNLINRALTCVHWTKADSISPHYISSVKLLSQYASQIAAMRPDSQTQYLAVLSKDIHLKFDRSGDNAGPEGLLNLVTIQVETVNAKNEAISSLNIHCTALGYKVDYTKPGYTFQQLTSPVSEAIVPGYYLLWATKNGSAKPLSERIVEISPDKKNLIRLLIN
jgi:hypothetical protein